MNINEQNKKLFNKYYFENYFKTKAFTYTHCGRKVSLGLSSSYKGNNLLCVECEYKLLGGKSYKKRTLFFKNGKEVNKNG